VDALSSCNGDEEETVACLVRSSFLHNIYAGCDHSVDDRTCQQKNAQFYQELSTLLNDESQPRDVSYCIYYYNIIIKYTCTAVAQRDGMFSVLSVSLFVSAITLERFEISS